MKTSKSSKFRSWDNLEEELKKEPESKKDFEEMDEYLMLIKPIISRRNKLGLSQRQLAKLCDFPQSTIGRIETGTTKPTIQTLLKLTKALGLTITIN